MVVVRKKVLLNSDQLSVHILALKGVKAVLSLNDVIIIKSLF